MGNIQNSINSTVTSIMGAAAVAGHILNQDKELQAANAEDIETIRQNEEAEKNDMYEAQQAILAHAKDEGLTQDEIQRLQDDPSYAQTLRKTVLKERRKELLQIASEDYNATEEGTEARTEANKALNKGYESLRELNNRIQATDTFRFNRQKAEAKIKARKMLGGKK